MQLPSTFVDSLAGTKGFDKEAFLKVHASGEQLVSIRVNPFKSFSPIPDSSAPIPWAAGGYYLASRPSFTFDPLFHAGCYYVQEASSMFLEQAVKQTVDLSKPLKVLDLCAAPGGKSTHIQSLISADSLLVSNEVIRSRANVLTGNMIKWGGANVVVTHNDPKDFSKLENFFDVIVVDAPCSGSGLFRRDPTAIREWSENNVQLCSQRQQRILAAAWPALKANGVLVYSTCSYSPGEDEEIVNWIMDHFPVDQCYLKTAKEWGIIGSGGAYRFWPDQVKGEGFFIACFQKTAGETGVSPRVRTTPEKLTKSELAVMDPWVVKEGSIFIKHLNTVYAWPELQLTDYSYLLEQLRVIYSGVLVGELMRDKLIPAHALAMSHKIPGSTLQTALDREQSVRYLQRKELSIEINTKGWHLVTYREHPLGWINVLPNRINNYYPKELRILKES